MFIPDVFVNFNILGGTAELHNPLKQLVLGISEDLFES
jgi:hypothetical protein